MVSSTGPRRTSEATPAARDLLASDGVPSPLPEELWKTVSEALADFVVIVDRQANILYRNRAVDGFAADKARPSLLDYVGPEERPEVVPVLERVFREGYKHYGEVDGPGPDDGTARYAVLITPVRRDGVTIAAMVTAKDITEQKQTEALVRERERSLSEAQVIAHVGSWSWDIDTNKLTWTRELHRIFDTDGNVPERWEPLIFDRIHPDDRDLISAAFLQGLDGATSHGPVEFRIVHGDGSELWATAEGSAEFDERGIPIRVFGTVQDITARKQMELALEARMQRAAALAELGQKAVTESDPRALMAEAVVLIAKTLAVDFSNVLQLHQEEGVLRVVTVAGQQGSARAVDITITANSHAGYTIQANAPVIVEDLRTELRFTPSERLLSSGVISHIAVVIHCSDGPWGVLAAHSRTRRAFTEDEGHFLQNVANVLGSALARKRAEEALRQSEERFRRIAANVQDIIFRYRMEPDVGIEYISPAAERISGHPLQEFYEDPDLTHKMTHQDDRGTLAKAFFDGATEQIAVRWLRPDGRTVWVEYRNMPERDDDGTLVAVEGVIRDITEIVLMQEALQQRREDLEARVEERFPSGNDYSLTFREMTVLQLIVTGRADKEIGQQLGISPTTVHKHVASILDKMKAGSRTEAGVRALREGLVV